MYELLITFLNPVGALLKLLRAFVNSLGTFLKSNAEIVCNSLLYEKDHGELTSDTTKEKSDEVGSAYQAGGLSELTLAGYCEQRVVRAKVASA